jgi:hypothetical protein
MLEIVRAAKRRRYADIDARVRTLTGGSYVPSRIARVAA